MVYLDRRCLTASNPIDISASSLSPLAGRGAGERGKDKELSTESPVARATGISMPALRA
jgi:hypothetical protein